MSKKSRAADAIDAVEDSFGAVFVRLKGEDGKNFAHAKLTPKDAIDLCEQILKATTRALSHHASSDSKKEHHHVH